MLRVVLDTSILVRMVLSTPITIAGKILSALHAGEFVVVVSPQLLDELRETLRSPFVSAKHGMDEDEIATFVSDFALFAETTPGAITPEIPSLARRDPDDVKIVAAAMEGKAAYLVSQDKDLLSLKEWESVRIVEASEFYQVLQMFKAGADQP